MKHLYLLLSITFFYFTSFAQQAYYNDVNLNLTGLNLKNELATKTINMHVNFLSYSDVFEADKVTDSDPSNSNNVLLVYGWENGSDGDVTNDLSRNKNSNGGSSGDWNREHIYAKSLGTPALGTSGPGADAHHLRPADVQRNGQRGNLLFAAGSGNSGASGGGWYPGDASAGGTDWRGDVARMIMYMYIRYGTQCLPSNVCIGSTNSVDSNMINLLLDWNAADPVSEIERNRNNYHENTSNTYAQGNRNPFIDEPYLATLIWGGTPAEDTWGIYGSTDTQAPTAPTNLVASNPTSNSIDLSWTASTDNVAVTTYDIYINNSFYITTNTSQTTYTVTSLANNTNYCFTIYAKDAAGNTSTVSNQSCETTTNNGSSSNGNELIFSEYIEGSSNNKALEIANFTGAVVSLNAYTIKKSVNGANSWDTTIYSFPTNAEIQNGDVYVVANSSIAICQTAVDDLTNSSVFQFNGNDPVGLFKNDVLIDIIGTLGDNSNFAKDITLIRKPEVSEPVTTFDINQWNTAPKDDCSDLGSYSHTLSVATLLENSLKIYPNPVKNQLNINLNTATKTQIDIYNVLGKKVLSKTIYDSDSVNTQSLSSGIYILKI
ncbi:MAG: endonuclease, partial [Gelidibacter sp.]|nr:endonuclease [Gelidibacter sp.]